MNEKIILEDLDRIIADRNIPWDSFSGSSVVVTGASGMLASYLVFTLLHLNRTNRLKNRLRFMLFVNF
jgi:hypothetical protein